MNNPEIIEFITNNYSKIVNFGSRKFSEEAAEDAVQDTLVNMLEKQRELNCKTFKPYVETIVRRKLRDTLKGPTLISYDLPMDGAFDPFIETLANDNCEFEQMEVSQDLALKLSEMHKHIATLPEKQRVSILNFLKGVDFDTDHNFRQAMNKLRNYMGGQKFKVVDGGKKPKNVRRGVVPKLSDDQVREIRKFAKFNLKGNLINRQDLADRYKVDGQVIRQIVKRRGYKWVSDHI